MPRPTRPETSVLVRERLEKDANDLDALFVLAAMRTQAGKMDEGLSVLDRVLMMDPSYPGAWFFKEKLHKMRGEPDQAETARVRGEAAEL
ncbi:MAG: hypothetical protein WC985_09500 [Thermoplasmata archaeon]